MSNVAVKCMLAILLCGTAVFVALTATRLTFSEDDGRTALSGSTIQTKISSSTDTLSSSSSSAVDSGNDGPPPLLANSSLHVVFFETSGMDPSDILPVDQANRAGISISIAGTRADFSKGFGQKWAIVRTELENLAHHAKNDTLFVVADTRDVIFNLHRHHHSSSSSQGFMSNLLEDIRKSFGEITKDLDNAVVFASEMSCCIEAMAHARPGEYFDESYPHNKRIKRACKSKTPGCDWVDARKSLMPWIVSASDRAKDQTGLRNVAEPFLNAGLVMGTARNLMNVIDIADMDDTEDDQAVFAGLMYQRPDLIRLDYFHRLFANVRFALPLDDGGCPFDSNNHTGRLIHQEYRTEPFLLHALNHFYECLDSMAHRLGEQRSQAFKELAGPAITEQPPLIPLLLHKMEQRDMAQHDPLHVIFFESSEMSEDEMLPIQQAQRLKIPTSRVGFGVDCIGSGQKWSMVRETLIGLASREETLVVVADTRDVLFNIHHDFSKRSLPYLVERVREAYEFVTEDQKDVVVFATEMTCCSAATSRIQPGDLFDDTRPYNKRKERTCNARKSDDSCARNEDDTTLREWIKVGIDRGRNCTGKDVVEPFLNAGLMIGKPQNILNMIKIAALEDYEDDQTVFLDLMYRRPDLITLDYFQHLFGTARFPLRMDGGGCNFVKPSKSSRRGSGGGLVQQETSNEPLLLHTPNHFYECLDSMAAQLGEERSDSFKDLGGATIVDQPPLIEDLANRWKKISEANDGAKENVE